MYLNGSDNPLCQSGKLKVPGHTGPREDAVRNTNGAYSQSMIDREANVRWAMDLAMYFEISAPLRAIFVSNGEANIHFDCYFDGEVSDEDRDSMASVEAELTAAFPNSHRITHTVHRIDYPDPTPKHAWCFLARREYFAEPHFTSRAEQSGQQP